MAAPSFRDKANALMPAYSTLHNYLQSGLHIKAILAAPDNLIQKVFDLFPLLAIRCAAFRVAGLFPCPYGPIKEAE
jgi:hypothetical protein